MQKCKITIVLDMIEKAHDTFLNYLTHIPDEVLEWKINELVPDALWIVNHVIRDQLWFAQFISGEKISDLDRNLTIKFTTQEELIAEFKQTTDKSIQLLKKLNDNDLERRLSYKGFEQSIFSWLYEYIHHLSHHGGQLAYILDGWKRKQRQL